jgi:hypothetical protein
LVTIWGARFHHLLSHLHLNVFINCWSHADYKHSRPGQVCGMLPVPEDNLSSMIYLSSNGLLGPKQM